MNSMPLRFNSVVATQLPCNTRYNMSVKIGLTVPASVIFQENICTSLI